MANALANILPSVQLLHLIHHGTVHSFSDTSTGSHIQQVVQCFCRSTHAKVNLVCHLCLLPIWQPCHAYKYVDIILYSNIYDSKKQIMA